jgi:DNA-binding beta-propeller fold protein YncE
LSINGNRCVQYFTSTGSFLGRWGSRGEGNGEFYHPIFIALSPEGARAYVTDYGNDRVQYFRWTETAVTPASLGRVKALFR